MKKSFLKLGLAAGIFLSASATPLSFEGNGMPNFSTLEVEASSTTSYKTTSKLNLRTGPSTSYKTQVTIPKGKAVTYITKTGSWYKVRYGSKTGYVSSAYLVKVTTAAPKPAPTQATVKYKTLDSLNLRAGASTKHKSLHLIPKGKEVEYLGKSGGWYKVKYGYLTGYVSSYYLQKVTGATTTKPVSKPASKPAVKPKPVPVSAPKEVHTTTRYAVSLSDMIAKQFSLKGQTDAYKAQPAYVLKSNLAESNDKKTGTIVTTTAVVNADTKHTYGTMKTKQKVGIKGETRYYYQVDFQAWRNAKMEDFAPVVDPKRFTKGTAAYYQFLDLSASANVSPSELNKALSGRGILNGMGSAFISAGQQHGVNEVYLVSHALLETGQGTSQLATGIVVNKVDGKAVPPKKVYNMFGIGAYDATALKSGSERAYKEGWTTPEKAIAGGAKYIGEAYVNHPVYKQNTLYKMRWNPANPGVHQYATDIGWAVKQTKSIDNLYRLMDRYSRTFDVPVYR